MPVPTDKEVYEFILKYGQYRLGCINCFRDDFDGVKELPSDWDGIYEFQSLKKALSTYDDEGDPDPPIGYSILDWYTHLGDCPRCK